MRFAAVYLFVSALAAALLSRGMHAGGLLPCAQWPYSLVFYCTLFLVFVILVAVNRGKESFTGMLLTLTAIKMLAAMVALVLAWLFFRASFLQLALHFLAHYVLFTVAEIAYLQRVNKQTQQQHEQK